MGLTQHYTILSIRLVIYTRNCIEIVVSNLRGRILLSKVSNKVSEVSRSNPSSDSRWPTLILKGAHRAIATWEQWLYFCPAPKFKAHFGHPITRNIPMLRSQIHHKTWRFLWFMVPRLLNPPSYRRLGWFLPRKSKKSWSPEVALVDFPPDGCPW